MSKNTANIARAISLLSDVLSRDAVAEDETAEADPFDDSQASEFDDLKHQALEFGQEVVDDLDTISDELDRTLEATEFDDDDDTWADDGGDLDDDDDDEDGDEEQTETSSDEPEAASPAEPDEATEVEVLQKTTAALEKSNEELTDKVDDLTEALQHIDALIDDLSAAAKEFVSEVETL